MLQLNGVPSCESTWSLSGVDPSLPIATKVFQLVTACVTLVPVLVVYGCSLFMSAQEHWVNLVQQRFLPPFAVHMLRCFTNYIEDFRENNVGVISVFITS